MPRQRVNTAKYTPEMAARFAQTRKEASLTFQEASQLLGFNESYLKAVEYGNISPSIPFILQWHKKLKKTYTWIMEG